MEISIEPNLNDEQLLNIHKSYKQDKLDELNRLKALYPELFKTAKNYFYANKKEIFHDVKNTQLRNTNSLEN